MTPDQAKAGAEMMAAVWEGEFPATCQVLAAVKDDNRDYKPDPKSRTAWQLAAHLATADIWFIECITAGKFHFDPEATRTQEAGFRSVNDIVDFYKRVCAFADETINANPLDAMASVPWWPEDRRQTSLHRLLVHVIAETNRHCGHADIVRELLDGEVGLRADNSNLASTESAYWDQYRQKVEQAARRSAGLESGEA
jgi:uncharacterized damage-inducible protein DinB